MTNMSLRPLFGFLALAPLAILALNGGPSKIRFAEIAAKAGAQPNHRTRIFGGKNGAITYGFGL